MAEPSDNAAELISAYLDDEVSIEEAASVEAFLDSSADARKEFDDLKRMLAVVSGLPAVEAPPDFAENLDRKLRRSKLLSAEGLASGVFSMAFQVISILVILAIAVTYMMVQLDGESARLEKDADAAQQGDADPSVDRRREQ